MLPLPLEWEHRREVALEARYCHLGALANHQFPLDLLESAGESTRLDWPRD